MAIYTIGEMELYSYLILTGISVMMNFMFMMWDGSFLMAKMNNFVTKKPIGLTGTQLGRASWKNYSYKNSQLESKNGNYQISDRSQTRLQGNTDFYIMNEKLGRTVTIEQGAAIAFLESMGLKTLEDAMTYFDKAWLEKNRERVDQALVRAANNKTDPSIEIESIRAEGEMVLMRLSWVTPFTIALSTLYNWLPVDAKASKNIVDAEKLTERHKWLDKMKGIDLKTWGFTVTMIIAILMGGVIAYNIFQSSAPHSSAPITQGNIPQGTIPPGVVVSTTSVPASPPVTILPI